MYLTFTDYQSMGGQLEKLDFENMEFNARKKIEAVTQGRVKYVGDDYDWETIKRLIVRLIEQGLLGTVRGRKKTSEGNDGKSVSYADDKGSAEALIREYLANEYTEKGVPLIAPSIQFAQVVRV
jgi:hypothetical protein